MIRFSLLLIFVGCAFAQTEEDAANEIPQVLCDNSTLVTQIKFSKSPGKPPNPKKPIVPYGTTSAQAEVKCDGVPGAKKKESFCASRCQWAPSCASLTKSGEFPAGATVVAGFRMAPNNKNCEVLCCSSDELKLGSNCKGIVTLVDVAKVSSKPEIVKLQDKVSAYSTLECSQDDEQYIRVYTEECSVEFTGECDAREPPEIGGWLAGTLVAALCGALCGTTTAAPAGR